MAGSVAGPGRRHLRRLLPSLSMLAVLFGLLLLVVVVLSIIPKPSAEFGLRAQSKSFEVELAERTRTDSILLTGSSLAGAMAIAVGSEGTKPAFADSLSLKARGAKEPITLVSLQMPPSWSVRVEVTQDGTLMFVAHPLDANAAVEPAIVRYSVPEGTLVQVGGGSPYKVRDAVGLEISAELKQLDLRLRPRDRAADIFQALRPSAISFEREEQDQQDHGGPPRQFVFGTIDAGRIWIGDAKGIDEITAIDRIRFGGIENGLMRPVRLDGGTIQMGVRGDAERISNSPGSTPTSLKPSLLDVVLGYKLLQPLIGLLTFFASVQLANFVKER